MRWRSCEMFGRGESGRRLQLQHWSSSSIISVIELLGGLSHSYLHDFIFSWSAKVFSWKAGKHCLGRQSRICSMLHSVTLHSRYFRKNCKTVTNSEQKTIQSAELSKQTSDSFYSTLGEYIEPTHKVVKPLRGLYCNFCWWLQQYGPPCHQDTISCKCLEGNNHSQICIRTVNLVETENILDFRL